VPLSVGSVMSELGARFDPSGFDRYDRRLSATRREAARGVEAKLDTHVDTSGVDRYNRKLRDVEHGHEDIIRGSGRVRTGLGSIWVGGAAVGAVGVAVAGLATGIGKVVGVAANFQKVMSEVKAVTGANRHELDQLSAAARRMGTQTGLGATQAAQAVAELAKGGLSASQIISGGLAGSLALAQAGQLDLATAASTTANALNLFGLSGDKATHVADALATAANATTADVGDFSYAFAAGGAAAKAAGLSFDQTTVALEAMAANGVKGQDAGTSLKSALTQLASPTKQAGEETRKLGLHFFDAHGKMRSLSDISAMLQDKLGGLTQKQRLSAASTIAGTDGMRALLALYDTGPKKLDGFASGLAKQGTAQDVARQKQDNLAGSLTKLRASLENIAITVGGVLIPPFTKAAVAVAGFLNGLQAGEGPAGRISAVFKAVATTVVDVARALITAGRGVVTFLRTNSDVQRIVGQVRQTLTAFARFVVQAFGDARRIFRGIVPDLETIGAALLKVFRIFESVIQPIIRSVLPGFEQAFRGVFEVVRHVVGLIAAILHGDFGRAWREVKGIVGGVIDGIVGILRAAFAPVSLAMHKMASVVRDVFGGAFHAVGHVIDLFVDKVLGMVTTNLGAISSLATAASHLPVVGGKFKGVADAIDGVRDKIDRYRQSLRHADDQAQAFRTRRLVSELSVARQAVDQTRKGTDAHRIAVERLNARQDALRAELRKTKDPAGVAAGALRGLGKSATGASGDVADAVQSVGGNLNSALKAMGSKPVSFRVVRANTRAYAHDGDTSALVGHLATGGIPHPGSGAADDHLLIDRHGRPVAAMSGTEGVLNRPQMDIVHRALAVTAELGLHPYGGLDQLWGSGLRHYAEGGVLGRANALDRMHLPYVWGGHHGDRGPIRDPRPGVDCSSAVSYVLGIPPRVSGAFESYGQPGAGPVTLYANPDHVFMSIYGRGFGTSAENPGGGAGWLSYNSRPGFVVRHVSAADVGMPSVRAPRVAGPAGALRTAIERAGALSAGAANRYLDRQAASMDFAGGQPLREGTLGKSSLIRAWEAAGGPGGATANTAAAIALAESNGDPNAENPSGATGAWQILGQVVPGNLRDLGVNARNAVKKWRDAGGFSPWVTYTSGAFRSYLAAGGIPDTRGPLGIVDPFAGPGKAGSHREASWLKRLPHRQSDRIADYERLTGLVDDDNTRYSVEDRRYGLSEEVLTDPNTGEVDHRAVAKRAHELGRLIAIRARIVHRLLEARRIIVRIIRSYGEALKRLRASLKGATKKDRPGIRKLIGRYAAHRKEWRGNLHDLNLDTLPNARLDLRELRIERAGVLGTRPDASTDTSSTDTGGDPGAGDLGTDPHGPGARRPAHVHASRPP
jgi:TP901 family phage tail tape measure protein